MIMHKKMGVNVGQVMENTAEDTFVKIMNGSNIFDMKVRDGSDDDLMSSDFEMAEGDRMQSAINDGSVAKPPHQLNISTINMGGDATQSSLKLPGEEHEKRELKRLQEKYKDTIKNRNLEVISNRKWRQSPVENVADSIDSRTRSMLNAIQGRSIFHATNHEESLFSNGSDLDKTNASKTKLSRSKQKESSSKRFQNRSQQMKIEQVQVPDIIPEFLHQPYWMNQSAVIHEMSTPNLDDTSALLNKVNNRLMDNNTPMGAVTARKRSGSRNKSTLKYSTQHQQSQQVISPVDFKKDNPRVEMRPLIGKGQVKHN